MRKTAQQTTKLVYEDPEIVEGYIQRIALKPKNLELILNDTFFTHFDTY